MTLAPSLVRPRPSQLEFGLASMLETFQDFLIMLGIKAIMYQLEVVIFSLYHVIVRPTKIMNRADKNWAHF